MTTVTKAATTVNPEIATRRRRCHSQGLEGKGGGVDLSEWMRGAQSIGGVRDPYISVGHVCGGKMNDTEGVVEGG